MFAKLKEKIKNNHVLYDYGQMWPFIKPCWGRALLAILLTLPVGAMDAVIAWALKPYMDVMMIEKNTNTMWIPLVINFIQRFARCFDICRQFYKYLGW